jgi:hypothetical protein
VFQPHQRPWRAAAGARSGVNFLYSRLSKPASPAGSSPRAWLFFEASGLSSLSTTDSPLSGVSGRADCRYTQERLSRLRWQTLDHVVLMKVVSAYQVETPIMG